jgi:hypothetical protein
MAESYGTGSRLRTPSPQRTPVAPDLREIHLRSGTGQGSPRLRLRFFIASLGQASDPGMHRGTTAGSYEKLIATMMHLQCGTGQGDPRLHIQTVNFLNKVLSAMLNLLHWNCHPEYEDQPVKQWFQR